VGNVGHLVLDDPHCPQIGGMGDLWVMWAMWSSKLNRSAPNEIHATRYRLYVYTVVFLFWIKSKEMTHNAHKSYRALCL